MEINKNYLNRLVRRQIFEAIQEEPQPTNVPSNPSQVQSSPQQNNVQQTQTQKIIANQQEKKIIEGFAASIAGNKNLLASFKAWANTVGVKIQ